MNDRWTTDHVLSLSPDATSAKAAGKLVGPAPWAEVGCAEGALWGACKGSGSKPYRTVVDLTGPAFHCSCPSRKFPCKHALALTVVDLTGPAFHCSCPSRKFPCKHALALLLRWSAEGAPAAEPPEWAAGWLEGRRQRGEAKAAKSADPGRRAAREARVAAGAAELRSRLADGLRAGLADAPAQGYRPWDAVAARMVDAQAPGLASRVRELGAISASGEGWPGRLLESYALLDLLAAGYERVAELPEGLAATVRSRVGFTTDSAEVLQGVRVRDHWLVLGSRDSADDRLTTRRIWLHGSATGRIALLLSFGRPGVAPDLALPTGLHLEADLAYHPAARPLRAVLGERYGAPSTPPAPPPGASVDEAHAAWAEALADDPWLDSWPVVLQGVTPVAASGRWHVTDATGSVPLLGSPWLPAAVSAGEPLTLFGEFGPDGFTAVTAWHPQSAYPRAVAL
ncbi:SWIM zinc finger family protein [Streptacidiphilus monticola]|uniref:SWIM zinc finger family protein n=1 Tax=Streptacidiphilus monticola TaxID=2161674 RepID=A0ABW1FWY8_9ACTN